MNTSDIDDIILQQSDIRSQIEAAIEDLSRTVENMKYCLQILNEIEKEYGTKVDGEDFR